MGARLRNQATVGDLTGSSELLVPGRAISSSFIPQGALSIPISGQSLRGDVDVVQIAVGANAIGILELDASSKDIWKSSHVHWVRALRLADDCHSYNIHLRKYPNLNLEKSDDVKQKLVLQAVRPVEAGQELLLWFSEDILATLHMGFLTPANIQGQKNYVCTKCSTLYESPNPLKLHLMLACGKYSIKWLWERLSQSLNDQEPCTNFQFSLKTENSLVLPMQKIAIDLSPEKSYRELSILKTYSSSSAFKPFIKTPNDLYNYYPNTLPTIQATTLPTNASQFYQNRKVAINSSDEDAQIESLVSSLGKYKEGHVCLYCGKSYSRKYGLKIHIRTHTGYKPLKCKYCMRPFGDPSNLNKHVRLHAEGETPYKCELCGKVLVRRRDLERHLKSRHVHHINATTINSNNNNNSFDDDDDSNSNDGSTISSKSTVTEVETGSGVINNELVVD